MVQQNDLIRTIEVGTHVKTTKAVNTLLNQPEYLVCIATNAINRNILRDSRIVSFASDPKLYENQKVLIKETCKGKLIIEPFF